MAGAVQPPDDRVRLSSRVQKAYSDDITLGAFLSSSPGIGPGFLFGATRQNSEGNECPANCTSATWPTR